MSRHKPSVIIASLLIALLGTMTATAQRYKFRMLGLEQGLCHNTVYDAALDRHGFVWFATGTGACRYDGFTFTSPDELPHTQTSVLYEDSANNLWIGYNTGVVARYDGSRFAIIDSSLTGSIVNQITITPAGNIIILRQNEAIVSIIDGKINRFDISNRPAYKTFNAISFIDKERLLLGCSDGAYICRYEESPFSIQLDEQLADIDNVTSIVPEKGTNNFWLTSQTGLFHIGFEGADVSVRQLDVPDLDMAMVQSVTEDHYKELWVSTKGAGMLHLRVDAEHKPVHIDRYNSSNGFNDNTIRVFEDRQHALWVATYEDGVACLANRSLSFWNDLTAITNDANSVIAPTDSDYWIGGHGTIVHIKGNGEQTTITTANGLPNDDITALLADKDKGLIWIGTASHGVYCLEKDGKTMRNYYYSANSLSNSIHGLVESGPYLVVATMNGVLALNTATHTSTIFNTYNGLPHNNIRDIYKDQEERIWVATNSNAVFTIDTLLFPNRKEYNLPTGLANESAFTCVAVDDDGFVWAGTDGFGVFRFDPKTDSVVSLTTHDGLLADYCYALKSDHSGHIWIGHRLGLSRIDRMNLTVSTFGKEYGITGDVNANAFCLTPEGDFLAGLTNGVLKYNLTKEEPPTLPRLNLTSLSVGDSVYDADDELRLPFNRYRVQFHFIGLQYEQPEAVVYQYMLRGYDSEWSEPTSERYASYPRLENGDYSFVVRACIDDVCTEETTLFEIEILKPFWKRWWFILLMIGLTIYIFYLILRIRERTHRRQQEYLERELDARTREVRLQKTEIEAKNKDITDSINYAQRIQFSVLPSTKTLMECCTDAFIFYRPRDIVSGDFYWFDYLPETDRLLLVCADSTGHGVPGAFMSLIGTTLIKDIVMRPGVDSPKDVLQCLDESIQSTLNQNNESEMANDGMDIIVLDINMKNLHTRISAAMRPTVVYHHGERIVFKGDHLSIGGQKLGDKKFTLNELDLEKGDTIYLFSDGYADQFGGPSEKKFKVNRLLNVLDDIQNRSMDEQHRVLRQNFELWKGSIDQVDDVLLIGLKV